MYSIRNRTEVAANQLHPVNRAWGTYTGAGPFRFETFIRTHSRANRRHLAQGNFPASGWSGATSGDGSHRRLDISHFLLF
jgi:hypothetical protein